MRALFSMLFLGLLVHGTVAAPEEAARQRSNVLLITADDLNWDSLGVTGCKVPDITPNLDRLARGGLRFQHAHVTIAVCQPCRSVLMTGRYPHRNGALGFQPISRDVPTLQESLRAAGYLNGIMAKVPHLAPLDKFCWDTVVRSNQLGRGRNPDLYYQHAKAFFDQAVKANKPFFLMANTQDPHRPFAGSQQEQRNRRPGPAGPGVRRTYQPNEISVPGFLPDIPPVRKEIAQYYTSVHRCDESVGAVLKALKDAGVEKQTLVMFLSDHGMALPFAKTNCYLNSTRTPWIVRWSGQVQAGTVDHEHFISGIDFMPTILDALDLPAVKGMDGRSFLPLLQGKKQEGREQVYTVFHRTAGRRDYPMRSIQNKKFGYIYNAWADGKTVFRNESQAGLTMRAMKAAADSDPTIAARVQLFLYRVPEELYDYEKDSDARHNLIDDPAHQERLAKLRKEMLQQMKAVDDPLRKTYEAYLQKVGAK
jgi:N-sulfoglucosamine sulfohydrolase